MRIWTVAIIGTGVLGVFLVLGRGDSKSDRSPPNTPPIPRVSLPAILQLGGQQAARCATGPIYHRFAQMTIQLDGLPAEDADRLVVTVQPLWPGRQERDSARTEMPRVRMTRRSIDRAEAVLGLESDHGPMPVGPYCVVIYHWQEGIFRQIAEQPFFVIFNAFDPVDRSAHHWRAGVYLTDTMYMAQKSEEGEPRLYDWHLGILRDQVFCLAIRTVAGSRDPRVAVQRVAAATACRIEGFWPELAAADGRAGAAGGKGPMRRKCPRSAPFPASPQRRRADSASIIRPCLSLCCQCRSRRGRCERHGSRRDRTPASSKSLSPGAIMYGRRFSSTGNGGPWTSLISPGPPRRHLLEL